MIVILINARRVTFIVRAELVHKGLRPRANDVAHLGSDGRSLLHAVVFSTQLIHLQGVVEEDHN